MVAVSVDRESVKSKWLMAKESGGESRRYLKWACNRSDILHQLTKKKTGGRIGHATQERETSPTLTLT